MRNRIAGIFRAKLRANGCCEVPLRGRCMEPLLQAGDRARVYPKGDVRVGDVALIGFESNGIALHRVVKTDGKTIMVKGDFSRKAEIVEGSDIIGIAQEFFLDGKGWAEDPRSHDEILNLVEISLRVMGKSSIGDARNCRETMWEMNCAARRAMLDKLNEV